MGRRDDIITTAGYRVGPFDVESTLIEHAAVAESAVVGLPDPERGQKVAAFVVLRSGHAASDGLADELRRFVRTRLSAHAYPRHIQFVESLPKTPSGKIQRFLLRRTVWPARRILQGTPTCRRLNVHLSKTQRQGSLARHDSRLSTSSFHVPGMTVDILGIANNNTDA